MQQCVDTVVTRVARGEVGVTSPPNCVGTPGFGQATARVQIRTTDLADNLLSTPPPMQAVFSREVCDVSYEHYKHEGVCHSCNEIVSQQIQSDANLANMLGQLDVNYDNYVRLQQRARNRMRGQNVYNFVHQSLVVDKATPIQRQPKSIKLEPISWKVQQDIREAAYVGKSHKEKIQRERNNRRVIKNHRAAQQQEYNDMKSAPSQPPTDVGGNFEKLMRTAQYKASLWSRKVERNKQQAQTYYEAKGLNKKFVAPLGWDAALKPKQQVPKQKVPPQDLPPVVNQADPFDDSQDSYEPTSFQRMFDQIWPALCQYLPECDMNKFTKFGEGVVLLMVNLRQATTWTHMGTILLAWIASYYPHSMVGLLTSMVQNIISEVRTQFCNQADNSWLDKAREVFASWKSVVDGEVIRRIKKIVAILVAAGICSLASLPFGVESFTEFYKTSGVDKLSSLDIVTYIFDCIIFLWERGMAFFTTGKWQSFFSTYSLPQQYEHEYAALMSKITVLENGTLSDLGIEEAEYLERVDTLLEKTKDYLKTVPSAFERKVLQDKLLNVEKLKVRMFEITRNVTLRRKPFTILVYGESNIGKSVLISTLMNAMAQACNIPNKLKNKVSLNADDKYQSEYQTWHCQVTLDDIAQTQHDKATGNPNQLIINLSNNEPKFALKADVGSKGQVLMTPLLLCGSTNVKDIDSGHFSNYPVAVMRRFEVVITPTVNEQYKLPNNRGLDTTKTHGLVGEYCTFKLERCVPIRSNPCVEERTNQMIDRVGFELLEFQFPGEEVARKLDKISYHELLVVLCTLSKAHLAKQSALVQEMENLHTKPLCPHMSYEEVCPHCGGEYALARDNLVNQAGESYAWAVRQYKNCPRLVSRIIHRVPDFLSQKWSQTFDRIVSRSTSDVRDYACAAFMTATCISTCVFMCLNSILGPIPAFTGALCVYTYVLLSVLKSRFTRVMKTLVAAPFNELAHGIKRISYTKPLVVVAAIVAGVVYVRRVYKGILTVQNLTRQSEERVPDKDPVQRVNHWKPVFVSKPPVDDRLRTSTTRQVCDVLSQKLCLADFHTGERGQMCNVLPLQSNIWLVPLHVIQRHYENVTIRKCPEGMVGPTFTACLGKNVYRQVGNTDLAVVYIPAGGSQLNLMHLFPDGNTNGFNAGVFVVKRKNGSILIDNTHTTHVNHIVDGNKVPALVYKLSEPTAGGMCMGCVVSSGKTPYIMGLHVAGLEVTGDPDKMTADDIKKAHTGVAVQTTRKHIQDAIDALFTENPITVKVSDESAIDLEKLGVKLQGSLHYKSPLNFLEHDASVTTWGAHDGTLRRFNSAVQDSFITKEVEEVFGVPNVWGPPHKMNSYEPWRVDVMNLTSVQDIPPDLVELAYADLRKKIFSEVLKPEDKKKIHPYTLDVALAGADAVYGVEGLNLNTSTGWPTNDKKWKILTPSARQVEGITRPLDMPDAMMAELEEAENKLADGQRMYFVHRANLKDEPTRLDKTKVRVFAGSPLQLSVLFRKYFLAICKYIMEHSVEFECAVGVNAHGPEWSRLVEAMAKYGTERMIAGDYKAFDSTMCAMISLLGFKLMIEIAAWAGYTTRQLTIMLGIATEICYPLYEYNGEFDMYCGGNPSGHGGTVFINNFAGSLYYRIAYYDLSPLGDKTPLFHTAVSLVCYGDDNASSVKEGFEWFNHTAIAKSLSRYGVTYTMADKLAESIPFITLSELDFLKRRPVWDDELGQYMAPLAEASIHKSLHSVKFSKSLTPQEHAAACIVGAVAEYFQHGREIYTDRIAKLNAVVDKAGIRTHLPEGVLMEYDEYKKLYIRKYIKGEQVSTEPEVVRDTVNQADEYGLNNQEFDPEMLLWAAEWVEMLSHTPRIQLRRAQMSHCRVLSARSLKGTRAHRIPTAHRISKRQCVVRHVRDENSGNSCPLTLRYTTGLNLASGEKDRFTENNTYDMSGLDQISKHQNLVFRDGAPQWSVGMTSAMDSTRMVATHDDATLGEFLSRPVSIASYNWTPGTAFVFTPMDPWSLFFNQKRVINKICNFNIIQPKQLHVKVMINGTSFHYGELLVHYIPLPNSNTVDGIGVAGRFTLASQRMHLTVDPCTSQGGEFTLPFIWPYNGLSVPLAEWNQLGQLVFEELVPLKHANGGTAPVNITVYAWAEDVKLSIPTTLDPSTIVPQGDEYGTGAVGRMASSVSKAAGMLSSVPSIAPFAKATGMIANGMGMVAKAYGFSSPPIVADVANMRPQLVGPMANTDRGDNVTKLTVDSKQELTIDPRIFGVDTGDELVLTNLVGRQAILTQYQWPVSAASGTLLWNVRVNPMMSQVVPGSGYSFLPTGFAALPFRHWRGTIRYRFQIVASAYHKGRLRIVYDPQYVGSSDTNTAYTRIIDLADERDFTIDVAWGQPQTWLKVPGLPYTGANGSTTAYTTSDVVGSNGVLACYVLNDLTTPNDAVNNDITIVVYASMCTDAEFNVLDDLTISGLTFKNQSEAYDNTSVVDDNAPLDIGAKECMSECLPVDETLSVYFGESITSFRTALKRYNYHKSYLLIPAGLYQFNAFLPTFPESPGVYTTGTETTATVPNASTAAVFANLTLLNYLTPAFLAVRGGIRQKIVAFSDNQQGTFTTNVSRYTTPTVPPIPFVGETAPVTTNQSLFVKNRLSIMQHGIQGTELTYNKAQPILSVELPYYNYRRFDSAKDPGYTQSPAGLQNLAMNDRFVVTGQVNATAYAGLDRYVAAGEDFQLFLFQGCPPLFIKTFT